MEQPREEAKEINKWFKDWKKICDAVLNPDGLDSDERPFCRDCADENGICPTDNLPCDSTDRIISTIQQLQDRIKELEERREEERKYLSK